MYLKNMSEPAGMWKYVFKNCTYVYMAVFLEAHKMHEFICKHVELHMYLYLKAYLHLFGE